MTNALSKSVDTYTEILQKAVFLFSQTGYSGVSMRHIAQAVGISVATLYHHFPDKDALYFGAVKYAFSDKASQGLTALQATGTVEARFRGFIRTLVELMGSDADFRRLLQRELLDGDEHRLELLATQVFTDQVKAISHLVQDIAPDFDPHMLVFSIAGMVIHHFESRPLRRFYSESKPEHDDLDFIANHITRLLLYGILGTPQGET